MLLHVLHSVPAWCTFFPDAWQALQSLLSRCCESHLQSRSIQTSYAPRLFTPAQRYLRGQCVLCDAPFHPPALYTLEAYIRRLSLALVVFLPLAWLLHLFGVTSSFEALKSVSCTIATLTPVTSTISAVTNTTVALTDATSRIATETLLGGADILYLEAGKPNVVRKFCRLFYGQSRMQATFTALVPFFEGKESEDNWNSRFIILRDDIPRIADGNGPKDYPTQFAAGIRQIIDGIMRCAISERTVLSGEACRCLQKLAQALGPYIHPMLDIILPQLIQVSGYTKPVSQTVGRETFNAIITYATWHPSLLFHSTAASGDLRLPPRVSAAEWLRNLIIKYHRHIEVAAGGRDAIERSIAKGLTDAATQVREPMRATFWTFSKYWPDRALVIADQLSQDNLHAHKALMADVHNPATAEKKRSKKESAPTKSQPISAIAAAKAEAKKAMLAQQKEEAKMATLVKEEEEQKAVPARHKEEGKKATLMKDEEKQKSVPARHKEEAKKATLLKEEEKQKEERIVDGIEPTASSTDARPLVLAPPRRRVLVSSDSATSSTRAPSSGATLARQNPNAPVRPERPVPPTFVSAPPGRAIRFPSKISSTMAENAAAKEHPVQKHGERVAPKLLSDSDLAFVMTKPLEGHPEENKENDLSKIVSDARIWQRKETAEVVQRSISPLRKDPEEARRIIARGITSINNRTIDDLGYRKLQGMIKEQSNLFTNEPKYEDMLLALFNALETPNDEKRRALGRRYDNKFQIVIIIRLMKTYNPKYFATFNARAMSALITARGNFDARCHIVAGLEQTAEEIVASCSPGDVIDHVLDVLETVQPDEQGTRSLTMGLHVLSGLITTSQKRATVFSESQEQRMSAFGSLCLQSYNITIKRAAIEYCVKLHEIIIPEERFYSLLTNGVADLESLITYYVIAKASLGGEN